MKLRGIVLAVSASLVAPTVVQAQDSTAIADRAADVIRSRCVTCHQPGGDGPFSLVLPTDMQRRATMIAEVTRSGYMPPWKPVAGFGEFVGSRQLPDHELEIIQRWVRSGAPLASRPSDNNATATAPAPTGIAWPQGQPDLMLALPSYQLRADSADVFRNFVVRIPPGVTGYVRGMQFRPGSLAIHHANIRVDATDASRQLDAADPSPGYEGLIARSADFPDGQFLGWTPGQGAPVLSDEMAWRINGGSDLVVQLHLRPTGSAETIAPTIGFYLGTRGPALLPTMIRLGRQDLDVPPNVAAHKVSDSFTLPVGVAVMAVQPHAHYRARSLQAWAVRPDGSRVPLLRIDDWDVRWQDRYALATPVRLEAGSRITVDYVFDNSTGNPRNPDRPPIRSRWGWRSTDEMADLWLQVITDSDADRRRLAQSVERKMLTADAIGSEVLLAREPNHVNLRNDAAGIYLALGQPADALRHFEVIRTLQPQSAPAWFNVGVALEALGRLPDALTAYAAALVRDPQYSAAHNNSGSVWLRRGEVDAARAAFARAVTADPQNADAHANLGLVMIGPVDSDEALTHIQRALELKPELLNGLIPHIWLLCANPQARARRPADARILAERIVRGSTGTNAAALDALAACHAALGSFDEATAVATTAAAALPASAIELRESIAKRIALYRAGQRFVLPQ